ELSTLVKQNPGAYSYASCGIGTPHHFTMEVLLETKGLDMGHVGYKGCAPALVDVVGGHVPIAILSANLVGPYLSNGRLTAIGVTSSERYNALPDVPTLQEQGVESFNYFGWYGLMGPAKLPDDVVATITAAVNKV